MSVANLWERIADAGPAAVVLVAATLALLAIPLFLCLAFVLSLGAIAIGTMGVVSPGSVLQLVSVLALMIGLVGVAGLLVFDLVLPRLRIHVPSILPNSSPAPSVGTKTTAADCKAKGGKVVEAAKK